MEETDPDAITAEMIAQLQLNKKQVYNLQINRKTLKQIEEEEDEGSVRGTIRVPNAEDDDSI